MIWAAKNDIDRAIADFDDSIRLEPKNAGAHYLRGLSWSQKKNAERAIADYSETIRLDPTNAEAYNGRAWYWATCPVTEFRDGKRAIESAQQACELAVWKDWRYIDTLAAAYAEAGDFENAIKYGEMALSAAPLEEEQSILRERLDGYKSEKPYREE